MEFKVGDEVRVVLSEVDKETWSSIFVQYYREGLAMRGRITRTETDWDDAYVYFPLISKNYYLPMRNLVPVRRKVIIIPQRKGVK